MAWFTEPVNRTFVGVLEYVAPPSASHDAFLVKYWFPMLWRLLLSRVCTLLLASPP